MIKVCFFGTPSFVEPVREALKKKFELVDDIHSCDLIVVASYGKILSPEILSQPKYGAINIHPSDLPKYRGSSPIQVQIIDGVKESAVTFIKMDEEVDHGPVLKKIPFEILDDDTFKTAVARAFKIGSESIADIIERYVNKQIEPVIQDHSKATFTKILKKEDGYIDLENPPDTEVLNRMIRAYFPWPGVWIRSSLGSSGQAQEKIIKLLPSKMIQVEGKKVGSHKDFSNGYPNGGELLQKLGLQF